MRPMLAWADPISVRDVEVAKLKPQAPCHFILILMQILKEACPNVSVLGIFPPSVQSTSSYLPFRLFLSFRTMKIA